MYDMGFKTCMIWVSKHEWYGFQNMYDMVFKTCMIWVSKHVWYRFQNMYDMGFKTCMIGVSKHVRYGFQKMCFEALNTVHYFFDISKLVSFKAKILWQPSFQML